jgi:hypothetical protein
MLTGKVCIYLGDKRYIRVLNKKARSRIVKKIS